MSATVNVLVVWNSLGMKKLSVLFFVPSFHSVHLTDFHISSSSFFLSQCNLAKTSMDIGECNSVHRRSLFMRVHLFHIHRSDDFRHILRTKFRPARTIWASISIFDIHAHFIWSFHWFVFHILLANLFLLKWISFLQHFLFVHFTVFNWHYTAVHYSLYKKMKSDQINRCDLDTYFITNITQQFSTINCKPILV